MAYEENNDIDIENLEIPDMLFETSWEVCNKVGGIYTVVSSKARIITKHLENYYLIGPYIKENIEKETKQAVPPEEFKWAFNELEKEGIKCYFATWNIKGSPKVILIDFEGLKNKINDLKTWLWYDYKIDSISARWDFEEPMLFSYAVAKVLEKLKGYYPDKRIVGQYHEWMTGLSLLFLKSMKVDVKSIFTTHATMLGRALSGSGHDFYGLLKSINPLEQAKRIGVAEKHTSEFSCANTADVFTTVSEITAMEAEILLGKKPDVLLPNGLDSNLFPTFEETSIQHRAYRTKIREFLAYYFYPYYTIDLKHNLIFFISGRYEFKNKGVDVLIKALGKLNERLKNIQDARTITVFFWIPGATREINHTLLQNKEIYESMNDYINFHMEKIKERIIFSVLDNKDRKDIDVFENSEMEDLHMYLNKLKSNTCNPPLSAFELEDPDNDPIIKGLREAALTNNREDKVKVIMYPTYLSSSDNLLNLKYNQAVLGSHLGIFPSYYEPWGYTPLESAALGVPALTTDLAGFGKFIEEQPESKNGGIYVLKRQNKNEHEITEELFEKLFQFATLPYKNRVEQKLIAKRLSEKADWNEMIKNYFVAYSKSLEK